MQHISAASWHLAVQIQQKKYYIKWREICLRLTIKTPEEQHLTLLWCL